jgi:hypothetical protein
LQDTDRETLAIAVKASKLTGQTLVKVFQAVMRKIQSDRQHAQTPQGRQSIKTLMNHGTNTSTIPIDGDTRLFDRVARRWNVDYAFHKTGPKKYLLVFKTGQADAITACFSEYTKRILARGKQGPSIKVTLDKAAELVRAAKPLERERNREAARGDR